MEVAVEAFTSQVQQFVNTEPQTEEFDWTVYEPEEIRVICLWAIPLPIELYDVRRRSAIIYSITVRLCHLIGINYLIGKIRGEQIGNLAYFTAFLTTRQLCSIFKRAISIIKITDAIAEDYFRAWEFSCNVQCPFLVAKLISSSTQPASRELIRTLAQKLKLKFDKSSFWLFSDRLYVFDCSYKSRIVMLDAFDSDSPTAHS
jgi:hypothetical protein